MEVLKVCAVFLFIILSLHEGLSRKHHLNADDRFAASYCRKIKLCIRGGDVVCAFDKRREITAMFPDKCIYYAVNCFKQGRYKKLDVNACRPNITYSAERLTQVNGDPLLMFMTYLPSKLTKMANGEKPDFSLIQPTKPMEANSRQRNNVSEYQPQFGNS
ncbi:unnamed protein product [Arctia plantaginis]|uniref:Uncharacterized protein n=1 Tax=Arctia plantaginis TaxID=874455 RepID=A0A8S0ZYX0_ARCPL|nr:unnamed protein product [Arctia plantaginis]CAB3238304.1 unnamed protein product [Arctia plantaginis]